MKCVICKNGVTKAGKTTIALSRHGFTLVVKNVPAQVCVNCGEEYVDDAIASKILKDAEREAKTGVQVDIREYSAA